MKAKSIKGKSFEEIKSALNESMADGFTPTLAIVFISIKQERKAVIDLLTKNNIDVIGATSSGEFINGHQSEGEIVIILLDMPKDYYSILFEEIGSRSLEESTRRLVNSAFEKFNKPAFILITTLITSTGKLLDGEGVVNFIEKLAGHDVRRNGR